MLPHNIPLSDVWCAAIPNTANANATITSSSLERESNNIPSFEPEFFHCDPYCEFFDADSVSESLLSPDLAADLSRFDDSAEFHEANSDPVCLLLFEGDEFFDPVPELDPTAWLHPPSCHWFHQLFYTILFTMTSLFWDSLIYLWTAPRRPQLLRRYRRTSRMPTILVFPTIWMLMGNCVMMFASAYQGGLPMHPATVIRSHTIPKAYAKIEGTFERMRQLDTLVTLNFETLIQLGGIKHRQFQQLRPKTSSIATQEVPQPISETELDTFFDSYERQPKYIEAFFDADLEELVSPDLFNIFDICNPRTLVA